MAAIIQLLPELLSVFTVDHRVRLLILLLGRCHFYFSKMLIYLALYCVELVVYEKCTV